MTGTAETVTAPRLRRHSDFLGKVVHNLVLVYDSGYRGEVEFRVQCEVLLTTKEADDVRAAIEEGSVQGLEGAQSIVVRKIADGATEEFKQTIARAFADNIGWLRREGSR